VRWNWKECARLTESFLTKTTNKQFRAYGGWKLGYCQWWVELERMLSDGVFSASSQDLHAACTTLMQNQAVVKRIRALSAQVQKEWSNKNVSWDVYAKRLCVRFDVTGWFSPFEVLFYPCMLLTDRKDFSGMVAIFVCLLWL
jgi:hypothetical protein